VDTREDRVFIGLLLLATAAFILVLMPFATEVMWSIVAAIVFSPLNRRILQRLPNRPALAAAITLLSIIVIVVVPLFFLIFLLIGQASRVYRSISSGEVDFEGSFRRSQERLPDWAQDFLGRWGVGDFDALIARLQVDAAARLQSLIDHAFQIGQNVLGFLLGIFVSLYLSYFLIRDADRIARWLDETVPLPTHLRAMLGQRLVLVVRATIKGSLVVALVQGAIGGIVLALLGIPASALWAVAMAFLSLLPSIGTGIVWIPLAIYLLATGAVLKGLILIFCGIFVIGLVDNVLRPILVGRETHMPGYVVFTTTLGALALFGFNGLLVGPLIAVLFLALWDVYKNLRQAEVRAQTEG